MGRKAIYATLTKYQPYIDIIRRDLQIEHINVEVLFVRKVGNTAGYARWNGNNAFIQGTISVGNDRLHSDTLNTLMHEFQHIKDYSTGKLKDVWVQIGTYKNGIKRFGWRVEYDGVLYKQIPNHRSTINQYRTQPWELAAQNYAKQKSRLFPNNQLPVYARIFVASTSDGVKWYKG